MIVLALALSVVTPALPSSTGPIKIAAAANLGTMLGELLKTCGVDGAPTFGATGSLAAQIEQGAPFELFLAADVETPAKLARTHATLGAPFAYARGKLALWVPRSSPLRIETLKLEALRDPSVKRIAIANPALAPYGKLALEALQGAGIETAGKLVLGESVGQAGQFAASGAAQAALLPLSLAIDVTGRYVELPFAAEQDALVLGPRARPLAGCLRSDRPRAVLLRHGYAPP